MWRLTVRRRRWRVGSLSLVRERLGGVDLGGRGCGVSECPEVAEADGIVATPVLVRLYPAPRLSGMAGVGARGYRLR